MTRDPLILACLALMAWIAAGFVASCREIAAVNELGRQHFPADVRLDPP